MRFKIDCASLMVGRKFTVFALFYFVPNTSPKGAYSRRGDLTEGFLRYEFGILGGGAYIWSGLYMEELVFGILRYIAYEKLHRPKSKRGLYIFASFHFPDSGLYIL